MHIWILCVWVAWAGLALAQPAGNVQQRYRAAAKLIDSGEYEKALGLVQQGLAAAPRDLPLLWLRGVVLVKLRDYGGALEAYKAYLDAGPTGANRREAEKIVDNLRWAESTFLDVTVANGPASIYLDLKTEGVFCTAAPACHKAILPGEYTVIAERPGFERWTGHVTVANGQTATLATTLAERASLLTVRVVQPGARITVDGVAYAAPIPVAAGKHELVVSLAGHADARLEIAAHEGRPIERDVALVPIRAEAEASGSSRITGQRKIALAAVGAGLVAVGAGIVLDLQAKRLDRDTYELCPSPAEPCEKAAEAEALNGRARSRALQANVAFGVAGGAAIAAAVLWLTGAPESRVAVTPQIGAVAGLDLAIRF
ncbi:MAG TPA: PEGA domain-containing protein [Thermoanaerobaculia bacterium]|nr:PEGA domain-containing protein [Thermoanaerobaculia bacterium]